MIDLPTNGIRRRFHEIFKSDFFIFERVDVDDTPKISSSSDSVATESDLRHSHQKFGGSSGAAVVVLVVTAV